jgi:hypothetical protein
LDCALWHELKWCTDDRALEEEAEKKFGWILKIFFLGTAGLVGYQFFPYMGTVQILSLLGLNYLHRLFYLASKCYFA